MVFDPTQQATQKASTKKIQQLIQKGRDDGAVQTEMSDGMAWNTSGKKPPESIHSHHPEELDEWLPKVHRSA
jgi:hypothetical protein